MHQGMRKNDRNVKSIMKEKNKNNDGGSTGDIDEDSFVDDDSSSVSSSRSRDGEDSSKSASAPAGGKHKPNVLQIAGRETAYVLCSKTMAYLVLLLSSIACGVVTFYFIEDEEEDSFRNDFRLYARDIARASQASARSKYEVAESMALSTTSLALDKGLQFPFVTVPDFEIVASNARELSDTDLLAMCPLIKGREQRQEWEDYSVREQGWLRESLDVVGMTNVDPGLIPTEIHDTRDFLLPNHNEGLHPDMIDMWAPLWQTSAPPPRADIINVDALGSWASEAVSNMLYTRFSVFSAIDSDQVKRDSEGFLGLARSYIVTPVFDAFSQDANIVAFYFLIVPWERYFMNLLPSGKNGFDIVLDDSCGTVVTFAIDGPDAFLKGAGDLHDRKYDSLGVGWAYKDSFREMVKIVDYDPSTKGANECIYQLYVYPTDTFKDLYTSDDPLTYAIAVSLIFVFTAVVFLAYDWTVARRQNKVLRTATRTQAIVASLFPENVQERILQEAENKDADQTTFTPRFRSNRTKDQLRNFLNEAEDDSPPADAGNKTMSLKSRPIADLFPEATVIFADIVGFTAWSSTREPTQVFTLLENIYHSFDEIAKRRRVFKVETVGDCYVAVAGLPEPLKDHAVAMARFAKDILMKFREMVKQMVVELGPDTEELGLRVGIHSGPVTAGVLRGERARFQLFGDTMNTAARMESTGMPNRIQMSQETTDLLIAAGKSQWLRARQEKVNAKGKGELQTYWLDMNQDSAARSTSSGGDSGENGRQEHEAASSAPVHAVMAAPISTAAEKHQRLISWNTDILARLLTQIIARRESRQERPDAPERIRRLEESVGRDDTVLSEVTEVIMLPNFDATSNTIDPSRIELSEDVVNQLRDYVQTLAAMYRENPFHNFEHASHVTMSVLKLLSRIIAPADLKNDTDKTLHDHTYGITSDPMTQFAVVLSALIHDADHPGVPNTQLIKENASIATVYKNKSIAEQNSVDLAWDLLMDEAYADLRRAIYVTEEDFLRFRQLVVNIVLATDIMDKDLKQLRNGRWNKAFSNEVLLNESPEIQVNRKATIVMEHLIQASDVAHTMQHWHIYRKWNQRLFFELYKAFSEGRADKDPSEFWYEGEKGFFDFYIIPLAKKLKECGVFGVSSDEYLQYALQNRKEWELKGMQIVAEMMENLTKGKK